MLSHAQRDELTAAHRRGVLLLDAHVPDWRTTVRRRTAPWSPLDVASASDCVLGKLYGEYRAGVAQLLRVHAPEQPYGAVHGFVVSRVGTFSDEEEYAYLTCLWRAEIKRGRASVGWGRRLVRACAHFVRRYDPAMPQMAAA